MERYNFLFARWMSWYGDWRKYEKYVAGLNSSFLEGQVIFSLLQNRF